jgi:hypothetical protein
VLLLFSLLPLLLLATTAVVVAAAVVAHDNTLLPRSLDHPPVLPLLPPPPPSPPPLKSPALQWCTLGPWICLAWPLDCIHLGLSSSSLLSSLEVYYFGGGELFHPGQNPPALKRLSHSKYTWLRLSASS